MRVTLIIHILAGSLGLLAGYTALYASKGASLHRRAGMVFVIAMLTMSLAGLLVAVIRNVAPAINVPAASLTAYLVITSLTTLRPPARGGRPLHLAGMMVASTVGTIMIAFAYEAFANGGTRNGMPAFPFVMFGVVAVLGMLGDVRVLRSGPLQGTSRIARHLWRMTFALFIAALSFFIGQAKVIPEPIRIFPLLAMPVLAVFVTMLYWLWRVRIRRSLRAMVVAAASS